MLKLSILIVFQGQRFVLGFLVQLKEAEFFLEDLKSEVKLDFSKLVRHFVPSPLLTWAVPSCACRCPHLF